MPLIRRKPNAPPPNPNASSDVFVALAQGTTEQRWTAARALATMPEGVAALGKALAYEHDARVREAIFTSLARAATPESAEIVVPYVRSDAADVRTAAIDALRLMPEVVRSRLPDLLADRDPDVRLLSCEIARTLPVAEAAALMCSLLEGEAEVNVCAAAVEVLMEVGDEAAVPALSRCAARFVHAPFLGFAIKAAIARIGAQSKAARG